MVARKKTKTVPKAKAAAKTKSKAIVAFGRQLCQPLIDVKSLQSWGIAFI